MKLILLKISFHYLIVGTLLVACNNIPDCDDPYTAELIVQFVDSLNTAEVETILDSVWNSGNGLVYVENDTLSVLFLEVNPVETKTTFVFSGEDITDTLTVDYSQTQFLRSELCGIVQRFSNISITYSTFSDTTLVTNELLRNTINVQVFR